MLICLWNTSAIRDNDCAVLVFLSQVCRNGDAAGKATTRPDSASGTPRALFFDDAFQSGKK